MSQITPKDLLYTFRRCPYAIRARLALMKSGANPCVREIILRDKPENLLEANPKGTIPVLILSDGTTLTESYDIMLHSLKQNDPENWLGIFNTLHACTAQDLIKENDTSFKAGLDRYKYPSRYSEEGDDQSVKLRGYNSVHGFFVKLDTLLKETDGHSIFEQFSIVDAAILPFIRQAAHVDRDSFYDLPLPYLQKWLCLFLESDLFLSIMPKIKIWKETGQEYHLQKLPI